MAGLFRNWLQKWIRPTASDKLSAEKMDLQQVMGHIRTAEERRPPEPGRRIHQFSWMELEVRVDLDITRQYRITIFRGTDRCYSFTVYAKAGEYDSLENALYSIEEFLMSDQNISRLPDNKMIKGYYFGR